MSDLISLELHEKDLSWNEFVRGFCFAMEFVNSLPSAEPERRWTPVTERLPEEDIDVLLQFPKNMGVGYQEDGFWNIVTGNDMYCGLDEGEAKPIAWMPLPEPYRGE